jgi:hypothetical protein
MAEATLARFTGLLWTSGDRWQALASVANDGCNVVLSIDAD